MKRLAPLAVILGLVLGYGIAWAQFDGTPSAPLSLLAHPEAPDFDVQVHQRDMPFWGDNDNIPMDMDHGANCSAPPATHQSTDYLQAVFICAAHVMTAINGEPGYAAISLTPNRLATIDGSTTVIQVRSSTFRGSDRDWLEFSLTPWSDVFNIPCLQCPDLEDNPDRHLSVQQSGFNGNKTPWLLYRNSTQLSGNTNFMEDIPGFVPDKARRDLFQLEVSNTHVKFWMPEYNHVFVDQDISALNWGEPAVFQIVQHSYTPSKGSCMHCGGGAGIATTWHFDDVTLTPSTPFTIIHADKRALIGLAVSDNDLQACINTGAPASYCQLRDFVTFSSPAPANAMLKYAAFGNGQVSFDQGQTWFFPPSQTGANTTLKHTYFIPIPQGQTRVDFKANPIDGYGNWVNEPLVFQDIHLWAQNGGPPPSTNTPTSTPVPLTSTPTPSSTPTSTSTATATATASPVPPTATSTTTPLPPTSTPTATPPPPTSTATSTPTPIPAPEPVCEVHIRLNGVESWLVKPLSFCEVQ